MQTVKAWEEKVNIPTYKVGAPNKNPMFLEKRVYQGASGVVYPYPVIDKVYDDKEDKEYNALFLENEYLKVMILPELGGRIQMAYDKTNDYHFIYYNPVIKPALVGLTGPWISGGIEFNWPQHHRPSTFNPVDYSIEENADGSRTVWVHEIEIMFHTKGAAGFTLYPDKAYIEVNGKLYNRTPFPQTFLWWANPAVEADEYYQSVFPPDVNAVFDHGKREVSSFPIARGTYYKVDYAPGTDISRYQNIPVPTSYMAVDSAFDFVGGYHHQKKAGMLHIADRYVSPGKKQWTWGAGDFGKTWDRHLTDPDINGKYCPYLEIMTGVYTDNQPDFSWIMPNEERRFKQYFMPYKGIGYVKNATKEVAVNLEVNKGQISIKVYTTSKQDNIHIVLKVLKKKIFEEKTDLSPEKFFSKEIAGSGYAEKDLLLEVFDENEKLLIHYQPVERNTEAIPDPAKPIGAPTSIKTNEELYLAGLHLEQYRHATFSPVDYYKETLQRDSTDVRCNNAFGLWYLKHGQFAKAEPYFHKAIEKITRHNPNPYNGEPYYNLGLCLNYLRKYDEAYDAFFKACWNAVWQDNGYLQLVYIDCRKGDFEKALENVEHSLARNYHGMKARHLKAVILRKLNRLEEAGKWVGETLSFDRFDFGSGNERLQILSLKGEREQYESEKQKLQTLLRDRAQSYIEIAIDYANGGFYEEAIGWLLDIDNSSYPMVHYYMACYYSRLNKEEEKNAALKQARELQPDRVFPNRLTDILVLQFAIKENPEDYKALYYLGNLWYGNRQYGEARSAWEKSAAAYSNFPTVHRNLGIVYYNKFDMYEKALQEYEKAFKCDPTDARILFELDQLYKLNNRPIKERLSFLGKYLPLVKERDDLYVEYITLHNLIGNYSKALRLLTDRRFHPWEGGEGKVSKQYVCAKVNLAKQAMVEKKYESAVQLLKEAQQYPENIGEGKLYGAQENDIFYWLGCAHEAQSSNLPAEVTAQAGLKAKIYWQLAAKGLSEPVQALYYNDQDPGTIFYQGLALRKLGMEDKAEKRFESLIHYGEKHIKDKIKMDYFAVSLPELSVFEIDLNKRNQIHCHYLMGLGYLGLNKETAAMKHFEEILKRDVAHLGATGFFRKKTILPLQKPSD